MVLRALGTFEIVRQKAIMQLLCYKIGPFGSEALIVGIFTFSEAPTKNLIILLDFNDISNYSNYECKLTVFYQNH